MKRITESIRETTETILNLIGAIRQLRAEIHLLRDEREKLWQLVRDLDSMKRIIRGETDVT